MNGHRRDRREDPDDEQPWAELGLKSDEYLRIRDILGRRPTTAELAMYSVMWSEHCSYKSSKVHLRQFGDLPHSEALLVGIGENAGVVDVGDGYAVTFKVESHNHPSYVEPYQGAATGVGGIVRDILTMGARPIAVMDSLRFGRADAPTPPACPGVVAGVGGYGNCSGPAQHRRRAALRRLLRREPAGQRAVRRRHAARGRPAGQGRGPRQQGDPLRARTGGDGIGGVSVLAKRDLRRARPAKRPSVRWATRSPRSCSSRRAWRSSPPIWSPASRTRRRRPSCATSELASAGTGGMHVDLDTVRCRDSTLTPAEILMSESQERMRRHRRAGEGGAVPRRLPQVGRAGHRHR